MYREGGAENVDMGENSHAASAAAAVPGAARDGAERAQGGASSLQKRGASEVGTGELPSEGDGRAVIPENLDVMLNVMSSLSTPRELEGEGL